MGKTAVKTKIEGLTVRTLVEAERALELLNSRTIEDGGIAWNLAKMARKSEPEIKAYRKLIQQHIEGTDHFVRENQGIRLDPKWKGFETLLKAADQFSEAALDKSVDLGEGVGPIKYSELLKALPKRNAGTGDEPDWKDGALPPAILQPLMDWAIIE